MFFPGGYVTIADAIEADLAFFSEVDQDRELQDCVYGLGTALAGGSLKAFGWDHRAGDILPIPQRVWARSGSDTLMERRLHVVDFDAPTGNRPIIPILKISDLSQRYEPQDLFGSGIPKFKSADWDLSWPEIESKAVEEPLVRRKGGRNAKHDWPAFWLEVAYSADLEMLEKDQSTRDKFRQQMKDWAFKKWKSPPEDSTLNKMLTGFEDALNKRAKAARK